MTRAVQELGVSAGALSQQIKVLEGFLGVQLLERSDSDDPVAFDPISAVLTAARAPSNKRALRMRIVPFGALVPGATGTRRRSLLVSVFASNRAARLFGLARGGSVA
jgi:hypothetical protein